MNINYFTEVIGELYLQIREESKKNAELVKENEKLKRIMESISAEKMGKNILENVSNNLANDIKEGSFGVGKQIEENSVQDNE